MTASGLLCFHRTWSTGRVRNACWLDMQSCGCTGAGMSPDIVTPQSKLVVAGAIAFADHKLEPACASAAWRLRTGWRAERSKLEVRKNLSDCQCSDVC